MPVKGASRTARAMGGKGKSKSSGKKPHSIHVKRGKSGGFIVTHHPHPTEAGATPEDHVVPDLDALHDHLDQTMGDQAGAGEAPPEPSPAPAAAAAGPSPTMGM